MTGKILAIITLIVMVFSVVGCGKESTASIEINSSVFGKDHSHIYSPIFTKEKLPVVDGSTANIPLYSLILQRILEISEEEANSMINFTTTPTAYENMAAGIADMLLVYEASADTEKSFLKNVKLDYHEIGRDGLVFIVNEKNPIESLTTVQIIDIYSGKIKNWKEVGGKDEAITAYQRDGNSGSQALMQKLVMEDAEMADAPTELVPAGMGDLIDRLAEINEIDAGAIGYSVFYYAETMYKKKGLKFIKVDGVMPSNATIGDRSYPHTNDFFAVVRKGEGRENVLNLLYWILSEEGKKAIIDAGYVYSGRVK